MILSSAYLPPIWYFEAIAASDDIVIDKYEHFIKQSIRSRCHILSPNGIQTLIIPVVHNNRGSKPVYETVIANDHSWQRQHWRSLNAAYRRSAFFEFYMDDFEEFYSNPFNNLFEFNTQLMKMILRFLKFDHSITFTQKYIHPVKENNSDLRFECNTGTPKVLNTPAGYMQVFSSKYGFVPGLSIVDLLFNTGPAAATYLGNRTH